MSHVLAVLLFLVLLTSPHTYRRVIGGAPVSPSAFAIDDDTIRGRGHFLHDFPADNVDGSVNALIEIPSGSTGKFEVGDDGVMRWAKDRDTGGRREVDYLPFPVNYGMVPRTLSDDGDALDIVVLGSTHDELALMRAGAFVTGEISGTELGELFARYRLERLVICTTRPLFGHPVAYCDWSRGQCRPREGDLALDPMLSIESLSNRLLPWFGRSALP